jgi:hypothetical protein
MLESFITPLSCTDYLVFAILSLFMSIVEYFILPETKNVPLEEIAAGKPSFSCFFAPQMQRVNSSVGRYDSFR